MVHTKDAARRKMARSGRRQFVATLRSSNTSHQRKATQPKLHSESSRLLTFTKTCLWPSAAGSCELEVTADWQNVAKSVGRIDFVTGGFVGSCTGTLLNNVANDQKPYFLTANHCISTQTEAQSATVYWNYNTGDTPPGGTPKTNGANLLVTGASSDFSLLFLTGSLPGGLFFSGWDSSPFNVALPQALAFTIPRDPINASLSVLRGNRTLAIVRLDCNACGLTGVPALRNLDHPVPEFGSAIHPIRVDQG